MDIIEQASVPGGIVRPFSRRRALQGALAAGVAPMVMGFPTLAQGPGPLVDTAKGKIRGTTEAGVHSFKGIPYAASTAGANRFRPPAPVEPWAGIRDAVAFGASAPQGPGGSDPLTAWYGALQPVGEDCLSLNVFTPGLNADARRPVMVWIHGGAWASCAGSAPGFDGAHLAQFGDVVVVTVNHRLNLFGYVRLDDPDERFADSGNAGVLDLAAALQWVRDSIARFGGDPGNVTIFGQSGGAAKVSALLAMPAARGLFHKAIAQSCSGSLRLAGPEEAARMTHALAAQLGIEAGSGAAWQAVPAERIIAALRATPRSFRPVLDGRSFPQNPFDPAAPPLARDIPLMIGNAANEATLYLAADPRNFTLDSDEVNKRVGRFVQIDAAETSRLIDAYRAALPDPSPSDLLAAIATDYTYRRNTTHEAALQAAAAQAPVYAYVFNWKTPVMGGALRTPHTLEVPFIFGTTDAAASLVGTGPDIAPLTRMMMTTWVAFARTGNPNTAALPPWPRYDGEGRNTMMLEVDSKVASNPGGEARQALDRYPFFEYSMPINYVRA
jgi:para-nitrobenzyl esterase